MADWDLLLTDARIATLRDDAPDYGVIEDGALAILDGKIAWVGPSSQQPGHDAQETRSLANRWITICDSYGQICQRSRPAAARLSGKH